MKQSKLRIHTIEQSKKLVRDFNNFSDSDTNLLFRNCLFSLKIGKREFILDFDTAFYSEDNDFLFFVSRNGEVDGEVFVSFLDHQKISYHSVVFDRVDEEVSEEVVSKKVSFAVDEVSLIDSLEDAKENGFSYGTFYPVVKGKLKIKYPLHDNSLRFFDYQNIQGVLQMGEHIIFLVNQMEERNVYYHKVLKVLKKYQCPVSIKNCSDFDFGFSKKVYQK